MQLRNLPLLQVAEWAIVRRFQAGEILTANITSAGFAILLGDRDKPWLKISIGLDEQICLVRANQQFIRPVN